jgi:phage protein U
MWSKTVLSAVYSVLEKKRNYAFSANTQSETVHFQQSCGIRKNPIMFKDLTTNLTNFLKFWTSALCVVE